MKDDFFIKFEAAVKRGKRLHPGPYSLEEWREALASEIEEFAEAIEKWDLDPTQTLICVTEEAMDVAVVAFRMAAMLSKVCNGE